MVESHTHDGINSDKIPVSNIIPSFIMTAAELTTYLSRPALEGEEFNVYDSTNSQYYKYFRVNQTWKQIKLILTPSDLGLNQLGSTASNTLVDSADNVVMMEHVDSGIVKEIKVFRSGTIRVKCDFRRYPGYSAYARIYVNGADIAAYLDDSASESDYVTTSHDITIAFGDVVQIFLLTGQTNSQAFVRNFRIYYDDAVLEDQIITN